MDKYCPIDSSLMVFSTPLLFDEEGGADNGYEYSCQKCGFSYVGEKDMASVAREALRYVEKTREEMANFDRWTEKLIMEAVKNLRERRGCQKKDLSTKVDLFAVNSARLEELFKQTKH